MLHLTAPQLPDESVPIVRVHNGLSPANKGGRIWCQPLDDTLTPCSCGWQPGQVHYRRKLRRALPPELSASPRSRTRADPRLKFAKLAFADPGSSSLMNPTSLRHRPWSISPRRR